MRGSCAALLILAMASDFAVGADSNRISSIELRRTACFGTCPVYAVTIFSDGRLRYEGSQFVKVKGIKTKTIPIADFERLVSKINAIHFFELKPAYRGNVTDLPTTIVTVTRGESPKTVEDYLGAPKGLRELEQLIDTVANISVWVNLSDKAARRELERARR
ncbi:MAG TPA: DUF6438 domain-containing protein [Chthoniobacterales bacterium]|nr:DUF6438 domain-containing protein [Chthoniobacterales bacterium]